MDNFQNNETIKYLLENISLINKKYRDIALITGENFNIFKTLNVTTNEVRMHSAFIGELLNPKGSHDLGDVFFKEFISLLRKKHHQDNLKVEIKNVGVLIEKYIGSISENYERGGQIDLIIENSTNSSIIIENKIYAGDQKNQLLRYYNFGKENYSNGFIILYLTLEANSPSKDSLGGLNEDNIIKISYATDILEWLEVCKEKAVNHATLRETITQYIQLIKYLTNQTTNNQMNKELRDLILSNDSNLNAFFSLHSNNLLPKIKKDLLKTVAGKLTKYFRELGYVVNLPKSDSSEFGENNTEVEIHKENWDMKISFYVLTTDNFLLGIKPIDNTKPKSNQKSHYSKILKGIRFGKIENWDNWCWLSRYDVFSNFWEEISMEKTTKKIIEDIKNVLLVIDDKN